MVKVLKMGFNHFFSYIKFILPKLLCVFLCLSLFHIVLGNTNCNLVTSTHSVTDKDFVITRSDQKYVMCAAYYCSNSPRLVPLQLTVHTINYSPDNIVIHLEKKSISFRDKCGNCIEDTKIRRKRSKCLACPKIEKSNGVEVHIRLPNNDSNNKSEACRWDVNFNMSIEEYACDDNATQINIPLDTNCNVTYLSPLSLACIKLGCFEEIKNITEKYIYRFSSAMGKEACAWRLDTVPYTTFNLSYSSNISKYLYVFEGDLFSPKLHLATCSTIKNKISVTVLKPLYILYYNQDGGLINDAYFEVHIEKKVCNLPSIIENGKVEFHSVGKNSTKAIFSCESDYLLIGEKELYCSSTNFKLPVCIMNLKGELASDQPKLGQSNTSIIELDKVSSETVINKDNLSTLLDLDVGSGQLDFEYEDISNNDDEIEEDDEFDFALSNSTRKFKNGTIVHPWQIDGELVLFTLPSFEDSLIFICIAISIVVIVVITVICLIIRKNRKINSGLNRKFDTFQNPIYEKPVVCVPISDADPDESREKLDSGDLTDSTGID